MTDITITNQQNDAIKAVVAWYKNWDGESHFSLEGFAGSGKSTILPYIIDACGLMFNQVAFCAPTGKAAKVMTTKLGKATASTVHSLIYTPITMKIDQLLSQVQSLTLTLSQMAEDVEAPSYNPEEYNHLLMSLDIAKKELDRAYDHDEGPRFTLNTDSRVIYSQLVVVDEASMVNEYMASDLKMFGIPVLAMGDSGQLTPVEGKHGLLRDTPDFFLSEIHRQALDNPIIWLATQARKGERIKLGNYGDTVRVVTTKQDDITTNPDSNAMVLCGTNKKRWKLTNRVRKAFDYTEKFPMDGEPLIVCKNFRRGDALIYTNGDMVMSARDHTNMEKGRPSFTMDFEDEYGETRQEIVHQGLFEEHHLKKRNVTTCSKEAAYKSKMRHLNVDWSWAITVHKSQGSQWDDVVVHDESWAFRDDASKHLYTAITRAAVNLTVVQ